MHGNCTGSRRGLADEFADKRRDTGTLNGAEVRPVGNDTIQRGIPEGHPVDIDRDTRIWTSRVWAGLG